MVDVKKFAKSLHTLADHVADFDNKSIEQKNDDLYAMQIGLSGIYEFLQENGILVPCDGDYPQGFVDVGEDSIPRFVKLEEAVIFGAHGFVECIAEITLSDTQQAITIELPDRSHVSKILRIKRLRGA